jgi:hypothetical protein
VGSNETAASRRNEPRGSKRVSAASRSARARPDASKIILARFGDGNFSCRAVKRLHPETFFQTGDVLGHHRLRRAESPSGAEKLPVEATLANTSNPFQPIKH